MASLSVRTTGPRGRGPILCADAVDSRCAAIPMWWKPEIQSEVPEIPEVPKVPKGLETPKMSEVPKTGDPAGRPSAEAGRV